MKSRRTTAMLLLAALLLSACGKTTTETETTQSTEPVTETVAEVEVDDLTARAQTKDGLPEKDFGGEDFTILVETNANVAIFEVYWDAEELTGDVINDAVYNRDATVGDRFNVDIGYYMTEGVGTFFETSVMSGGDDFQMAAFHMASASANVTKGVYRNWYDIPHVDLTKPWWAKTNREDLTYKNTLFLAVSDLSVSSLVQTYCMFFNKDLVADYGLGDIYEIVNEGKWTVDTLKTLTANLYQDTDGDGARSDGDLYGFVTPPATALAVYTFALGGSIFEQNSDGSLTNVYMSERTVDSIQKLYSLLYENNGSYTSMQYRSTYGDAYHSMGRDFMLEGKAVFANGTLNDAITHLREMEAEFGVVPYVKLDEQQENYRTACDADLETLMLPTTVQDLEKVGILAEALSAESWRTVIPAVYEIGLKTKYSRDAESVQMLDLILDSRVFDFGYAFNFTFATHTGYASTIEKLLSPNGTPSSDVMSYYESNRARIDEGYQSIIDYYDEYVASNS